MYQKAFTLIEVMIVLTIIAILATVAGMSYHSYVVRSQLAEVLSRQVAIELNLLPLMVTVMQAVKLAAEPNILKSRDQCSLPD